MFKTVKRIIDWCGEFKGKLYLGFVMTFFSHLFAAMPLALSAYTVGLLIESQKSGTAFDTAWIGRVIVIQIVLVFHIVSVPSRGNARTFGVLRAWRQPRR